MTEARVLAWIAAVVAAMAALWLFARGGAERPVSGRSHVVLVGASIGQDWRLGDWPQRVGAVGYSAESIAIWQYDKSEAIDELLLRPKRKFRPTRSYLRSLLQAPPQPPQIVVLKECSSYFPGDLEADKRAVRRWVGQLRERSIEVVLATVVPVTRERAVRDPGKQEALARFNAWVRDFAAQEGLALVDLEAALREGAPGSFLREEFTSGDGSHLNRAAYAVLDRTLLASLCQLEPGSGCEAPPSRTATR